MPTLRNFIRNTQRIRKERLHHPVILQSGKWRFREEDVELMGIVKRRKVALYARVSNTQEKTI